MAVLLTALQVPMVVVIVVATEVAAVVVLKERILAALVVFVLLLVNKVDHVAILQMVVRMVVIQILVAGFIGYGLGLGCAIIKFRDYCRRKNHCHCD